MGHHYVPQRYLRGFQSAAEPGKIWMYDKRKGTLKHVPIKLVAQEAEFYDESVENELANAVETPGNDVIDKILRGEVLDDDNRKDLTYYLATMIRRVPTARRKALATIPQALADTVKEFKEVFHLAAQEGRISQQTLAKRLGEADAVHNKHLDQPPPNVTEIIEAPWPFQSMLTAIYSMWWRLFRVSGPSYMLTSDNPAYFFDAYGLGTTRSELVFPLCMDMFLQCSWQRCAEANVFPANERLVKEINRRIACGAERFIFYHAKADWISSVSKNQVSQLSRIQW